MWSKQAWKGAYMVSEKEIMSVRIKFSKTGNLMYISHLDLARSMQRIFVRSQVDIWYSEGFNPQPRIVFALPLPVGVESECELMDIKINHPMSFDEIKERIQNNFPSEMKVLDVYAPEAKFKEIVYADYTIRIYSSKLEQDTCQKINDLFSKECLINKRSKSGEKEVNICDFIKTFKAQRFNDYIEINTAVCAGNESNLNPELIIEAIKKYIPTISCDTIDEYTTIMRNKMLNREMQEFK